MEQNNIMVESDASEPPRGLRERKKAKTKAAIQHHALRLFQQQGYDTTTVEQIAEAAEISPSTFFRYFPNKEDVVLYDDFDPLIFAAFEAQPADLSPLEAMRRAFREVFVRMSGEDMEHMWERAKLVLTVPELRMRMLDQIVDAMQSMSTQLARRIGRKANDFAVRTFVGAVMGAMLSAMMAVAADQQGKITELSDASLAYLRGNIIELVDASLAYLEAGMPL